MSITAVNNVIQFNERIDLIKTLLYVNLSSRGIVLPEKVLYTLSLFVSEEDKDTVINEALDKKYVKSKQTAENTVTGLVKKKLLVKTGWKKRKVNPEIFQQVTTDYIAATFKIHNINTN